MNKIRVISLVLGLLTCCTACSKSKTPDQVDTISIGEAFSDPYQVSSGTMTFTVNSATISSNMKDLGVDPHSLPEYDNSAFYYDDSGEYQSVSYPDYVDLNTGELANGLVFVLVDITAANTDAASRVRNDGGGSFDSDYMFLPSALYLCDLEQENTRSESNITTYLTRSALWYSEQNQGYMYELRPGESKTYQIGFVARCAGGDYSSLYLTNASTVDLDIPDLVLVDLGLGTNG